MSGLGDAGPLDQLVAEIRAQIDLMIRACEGDAAELDAAYRARYGIIAEQCEALDLPDPFRDLGTIWDWIAEGAPMSDSDVRRLHLEARIQPVLLLVARRGLEQPIYEIDSYQRPDRTIPFNIDFGKMSRVQQAALLQGLQRVLAYEGKDVVESEWGKNLGKGLYEFRVRRSAEEIVAMFESRNGPNAPLPGESEKILLRVYFYPHGDKVILLLSAFDKGSHSKDEDAEIASARVLLKEYLEGWRRGRKSR